MSPIPKFNLIPASQLDKVSGQTEYRVTIKKGNLLYIPKEVVEVYGLANKRAKFYLDTEKKVIAWKMLGPEYQDVSILKRGGDVKKFTPNNPGGFVVLSLNSYIEILSIKNLEYPLSKIPVRTYKSSLIEGDMSYIDLKEAKRIQS